jgi:hypothetical protein
MIISDTTLSLVGAREGIGDGIKSKVFPGLHVFFFLSKRTVSHSRQRKEIL